eukprot:COSAG01_NODE_18169_length_1095_cov_29.798995_1_plen_46_part_10
MRQSCATLVAVADSQVFIFCGSVDLRLEFRLIDQFYITADASVCEY